MTKALRIDLAGRHVVLKALIAARFTHHGFGTFLESIKPGEISISKKAYDVLIGCRYRNGLQGLELFSNHMVAWGDPRPAIKVAVDKISLHKGAEKWLEKCCIIEDADS